MRVVLVSHRYRPDAVAGVERCTEALAEGLTALGDSVAVVARRPATTPAEPEILRETVGDSGTPVYRLVGGDNPREGALSLDHHLRLERLFEMVLLEMAPDVVHFNHIVDLSPRFIEIALRHRVAVVLSLHDFYFACPRIILQKTSGELCPGPAGGRECAQTCFAESVQRDPRLRDALALRAAYFRQLLSLPQYVLCPSNYVADYFRKFAGDGARIHVVPNGTWVAGETDFHRPTPSRRGQLNLAFLGSVLPHKGIHVILDAIELAKLSLPVRLDVHGPGDPDYAKALRERAERIPGVTLNMHGSYEPGQVPQLLRDTDCLLAPSQWPEIFLLVTREAMACGVPVVVTRLGALPDAVVEGENGFSFEHDRPQELAAILQRLAEDEDLIARLRAGARAARPLSIGEHVMRVRQYYKNALRDLARTREDQGTAARSAELDFLHAGLVGSAAPSVVAAPAVV